jgi:Phage integrase family
MSENLLTFHANTKPSLAHGCNGLRHTFGTRLIEKGAAPDAVQSSMGHASPVTLSRYTRSSASQAAVQRGGQGVWGVSNVVGLIGGANSWRSA